MPVPPFALASSDVADAPKSRVSRRAIWRVGRARGHPVAVAIGVVAQVRAAAGYPRAAGCRASWIVSRAVHMKGGAKPVGCPLPHVACHIAESVAVGREGTRRSRPHVSVLARILVGELALPDVAEVLSGGGQIIAPRIRPLLKPSPGRRTPTRPLSAAACPPTGRRRRRRSRRHGPQDGPNGPCS